jgi:UPF0755 protein
MTVRHGGGPREGRSQAHPMDTPPPVPERPPLPSNGDRNGGGRDRGLRRAGDDPHAGHGVLRFLVFLLVMVGVVGVLAVTVLRPIAVSAVAGWAEGDPATWRLPFVEGLVAESLASPLAAKASQDSSDVTFTVESGDTVSSVADRLVAQGLVRSRVAFEFAAYQQKLGDKLVAGDFRLRGDMTPPEVAQALIDGRIVVQTMDVTFREGLRIEQMTAKLETITSGVDPKAFYDLATKPPAALLAEYPWLGLPKGGSLEGFLYPATYTLVLSGDTPTTAEDLVHWMLDAFYAHVGPDRINVAKSRGLTFYEVVTLASIVEQEAVLDEERPLIAGVYQNRLDPKKWPTLLLQSDPTIFYVNDTLSLAKLPFAEWKSYVFWDALKQSLPASLPAALAGYNTYKSRGLPPGPICSPAVPSIEAALAPDTSTGYLFFIAKGDGSGSSAFAKTKAEHDRNVAKYGK